MTDALTLWRRVWRWFNMATWKGDLCRALPDGARVACRYE